MWGPPWRSPRWTHPKGEGARALQGGAVHGLKRLRLPASTKPSSSIGMALAFGRGSCLPLPQVLPCGDTEMTVPLAEHCPVSLSPRGALPSSNQRAGATPTCQTDGFTHLNAASTGHSTDRQRLIEFTVLCRGQIAPMASRGLGLCFHWNQVI